MHPERKKWIKFYRSKVGRKRYSQRAKTIEPLIGHIKELFNIEKLKIKGLQNVQSFLPLKESVIALKETERFFKSIKPNIFKRIANKWRNILNQRNSEA